MDGRTDKQTDSIVRAMHTRRERKNLQLVKFVVGLRFRQFDIVCQVNTAQSNTLVHSIVPNK